MNIRRAGYDDYGITEEEKNLILQKCQAGGIDKQTILDCAMKANPGLADALFYSMVKRVSFEKIDTITPVPAAKGDFYAYRRKAIAYIREATKGTQK